MMRPASFLIGFATCLAFAVWTHEGAAQANYHSAPLGGGAALRGGTGVALGTDGAAPFLNPATIARIEENRLAFSARFFRFSRRTVDDFQQPGPAGPPFEGLRLRDTSLSSTDFDTLPDSTCYFFPRLYGSSFALVGRSKLALCFAKTEERSFAINDLDFDQTSGGFRVEQSQSFREDWERWDFGPTFAIYLHETLAVGASIHLTRTRHEAVSTLSNVVANVASDDVLTTAYQSLDSGSSWDVVADLGALYKLSPTLTLGASVRIPSVHLLGGYTAGFDSRFADGASTIDHRGGSGDFRVSAPVRFSLGAGADFERVRVEFDTFLHMGVDEFVRAEFERARVSTEDGVVTDRFAGSAVRTESVKTVLNAGIGGEYFARKNASILFGLASDVDALPGLEANDDTRLFRSTFDAWHLGVGVASYSDYGDVTFGTRWTYMTGDILATNGFTAPPEPVRVSAREWGVMFVLAGQINLRSLAEAATTVSDALAGEGGEPEATKPSKRLEPAK